MSTRAASTTLLAREVGQRRDLSRQTMRMLIAQKIAVLIGSGVLSVGDALPGERDLAAALSVSRETVRGAIAILAERGIVAVAQGTRTSVATADVGAMAGGAQMPARRAVADYALDEVHAARLLIEAQVAALAAPAIDAETLATLERSIAAQRDCADDPVRFLICDREFHVTVYRACGNRLLADMATELYAYLLEHRRRAVARPGAIATSIADHRAIAGALAAHDADACAAAFAVHETRIYDTTRRLLAQDGAPDDTTNQQTGRTQPAHPRED